MDVKNKFISRKYVIILIMSSTGSILLGLITYGTDVFDIHKFPFQILFNGALGGYLFGMLSMYSKYLAIPGFIFLYLYLPMFILFNPNLPVTLVMVFDMISLGFAILIYFYKISQSENFNKWLKPFILAVTFAASKAVFTIILFFYNNSQIDLEKVLTINLYLSVLTGIGMGFGIEAGKLIDSYIDKPKNTEQFTNFNG